MNFAVSPRAFESPRWAAFRCAAWTGVGGSAWARKSTAPGPPGGDGPRASLEPSVTELRGRDPAVRCAACGFAVTTQSERIEVGGAHAHTFVNPAGLEFRVGCYRNVPGCVGWGDESAFWSWFPGCTWRVVLCRRCTAHLGWSFRAGDMFVALVLDRVVEEPGDAPRE